MRRRRFVQLYEEHAQAVFGFLAYRTGDRELAEDLLADTFEAAWRARERFDPGRGGARTWLTTIALNQLRDHARRRAAEGRALVHVRHGMSEGAEDAALGRVDDRDRLARAMLALSAEEREAVALKHGMGLTLKEVARVLDEPQTTIEGRVHRALRKLRAELDDAAGADRAGAHPSRR